jgi:hypothetical protein
MNLVNEAKKLKRKGQKIEEIAKKLGVSDRTVLKYTVGIPHPNNIHALKPIPKNAKFLTNEKVEILGYLAAEGSDYDRIDNHLGFDKRRGKSYKRNIKRSRIEFSNLNKTIQKRFQYLCKKVYDFIPPVSSNGTMRLYRLEIVRDIRKYSRFGSKKWSVPFQISRGKDKIKKKLFCRAYFDGEGFVYVERKVIRVDSINKKGLLGVQKLLEDLGVSSKFFDYKNRFRITIKDIKNYHTKIGFFHPMKKEKLKMLLGSN